MTRQRKWGIVMLTGLMLAITGCAAQEKKTEVPNPMVEVEGSDAFQKVGANIETPAGGEDSKYYIINDKIAEIQFGFNGAVYSYRASGLQDDISGVKDSDVDGKEAEVTVGMEDITIETLSGGGRLAQWDWDEVEYSLYTPDEVEDDVIRSLVKQLATETANTLHPEI